MVINMPMHIIVIGLLAGLLVSCTETERNGRDAQTLFFNQLNQLCGARFQGYSSYPDDPEHAFAGKLLTAHLASCNQGEIRIPFRVGRDQSRTWVITHSAAGLALKHDHRHSDGTPDTITDYGGTAIAPGSEYSQSFPADDHTVQLLPEAATNVWTLSLNESANQLTYYLERNNQPRFKATLQLDKNDS